MIISLVLFVIISVIGGGFYLNIISKRVYVEKSEIDAPQITLSAKNGGVLEEIYVETGDFVPADLVVARIGNELVKTKDAGLIISRQNQIGTYFSPGQAVVTMLKSEDFRVVGRLEEDKGLDKVKVGQRVIFTVDAFGSKQFEGVIDEVSPTSRPSDVVFNISDQRQENEFNVKARFNVGQYPELKNGMSAKMWIYQ
ncbi:MAG: efflux RND transporter periplasmic adaptor subunit [Candidatus Moranbacteria bacterium]|nr:efflux RND transporter periplasmic adaptor subunit [Candidatus Moranbacteria bacterium]